MAIDPLAHEGGSLLDHVDAALKGMAADLEAGDYALIGVIRTSAMAHDLARADGKMLSAMNYLSYVTNGIEKLGGSAMARKTLGKKADKPKQGLAAVRGLRAVPDPAKTPAKTRAKTPAKTPAKPRTRRPPTAQGA